MREENFGIKTALYRGPRYIEARFSEIRLYIKSSYHDLPKVDVCHFKIIGRERWK